MSIQCQTKSCNHHQVGLSKYCKQCLQKRISKQETALVKVNSSESGKKLKQVKEQGGSLLGDIFSIGAIGLGFSLLSNKGSDLALPKPRELSKDELIRAFDDIKEHIDEQDEIKSLLLSTNDGIQERQFWVDQAQKLSKKELANLAYRFRRRLKRIKEARPDAYKRKRRDKSLHDGPSEDIACIAERMTSTVEAMTDQLMEMARGQNDTFLRLQEAENQSPTKSDPVILGHSARVPPGHYDIRISPSTAPYFNAKNLHMFGIDTNEPGINRRFFIEEISVGGVPQTQGSGTRFISDGFNQSGPVPVNWSTFSTQALGKELVIRVFNPNSVAITIFTQLCGEPVESLITTDGSQYVPY